ncbi:MAG: hypothetical protein FRX49_08771 [Trebouxia sp. A1-2]|nr:MAG: hypothetical protein FRX49_08771 [Trebouxia sp. A1-2]
MKLPTQLLLKDVLKDLPGLFLRLRDLAKVQETGVSVSAAADVLACPPLLFVVPEAASAYSMSTEGLRPLRSDSARPEGDLGALKGARPKTGTSRGRAPDNLMAALQRGSSSARQSSVQITSCNRHAQRGTIKLSNAVTKRLGNTCTPGWQLHSQVVQRLNSMLGGHIGYTTIQGICQPPAAFGAGI